VARGKDVTLISRDRQIIAMKREGRSYSEISETFGITKARISQIVAREYEDVTDDSYREAMRLDLEGKAAVLNQLIAGPGRQMVSPGGKIICNYVGDGTDAIDYSNPVYDPYVKVDAIRTYVMLQERIARMHAIDRPKAQQRDESAEFAQAMTYVEQLADENKELRKELEASREPSDVVEAEVVTE
jgi:hypothetical protein